MAFGSKTRRIRELETLLDTAQRRHDRTTDDLGTAQFNQRTAINARERAENITVSQRTELVARAATIRRLRETNAALEQRLADLQAANEQHYADLAARSGTVAPVEFPRQREDGAA